MTKDEWEELENNFLRQKQASNSNLPDLTTFSEVRLDNYKKVEYTCTKCRHIYIGNYDESNDPDEFKFCPNCGRKIVDCLR